MKSLFAAAALGALAFTAQPAQAVGCLSGAAVGGTAGHFAGHHGVLGAAAGCAIGHHEAVRNRRAAQQPTPTSATPNTTTPTTTDQPAPR